MEISSFISAYNALEKAKEEARQQLNKKDKIQAVKRKEPLKSDTLLNKPKHKSENKINVIKARIKSIKDNGGIACFYVRDTEDKAYFYKLLDTTCKNHMNYLYSQGIINIEDIYKLPFNETEFKYIMAKNAYLYYDQKDNIILPENCLEELCEMEVYISPYDFIDNEKRVLGCSIKVKKVKICK